MARKQAEAEVETEARLKELSEQGHLRMSGKRVNLNDLNALEPIR